MGTQGWQPAPRAAFSLVVTPHGVGNLVRALGILDFIRGLHKGHTVHESPAQEIGLGASSGATSLLRAPNDYIENSATAEGTVARWARGAEIQIPVELGI